MTLNLNRRISNKDLRTAEIQRAMHGPPAFAVVDSIDQHRRSTAALLRFGVPCSIFGLSLPKLISVGGSAAIGKKGDSKITPG